MNWLEARLAKRHPDGTSWSQQDVYFAWRSSDLNDAIKGEMKSVSKLSRLEIGAKPKAKFSVFALQALADILDADLAEIDPVAAANYDAIAATVATRGSQSATWKTASFSTATDVAA